MSVDIVDYNPDWPRVFERERQRIDEKLRQPITAIEHIGSTAVPGLSARPVVDIAVLLPSLREWETEENHPLSDVYKSYPVQAEVPADHVLMRSEPSSIHLFLCDEGNEGGFKRLVRFRELLRADPELARRYETLKVALARKFEDDPVTYEAEKSAFIHTLEEVYLES